MELIIRNGICGYLTVMTLLGFVIMGIDKHKAKQRAWRIQEKTLFAIAFLGGGIGSLFGMYFFHHKTKHKKFIFLFPIAALLYVFVLWYVFSIM